MGGSVNLTPRQREILDIIVILSEQRGFPPTVREIAAAAGVSHNRVNEFLGILAAKGWINRARGKARGVRVKRHPDWRRNALGRVIEPSRCDRCGAVSFAVRQCFVCEHASPGKEDRGAK